jgi:D-tyrosyl-tRNA(Tyr) deacylase
MKVVVQRVLSASVLVEGKEVSSIGKGVLLLVGLTPGDTPEIADKMAEKIAKMRIFEDAEGKTNLSLSAVSGEILSVSQFTLYGSLKEGNRPSFVEAMKADEARALYAYFLKKMQSLYPKTQNGVFQADMKVSLVNDGPFTLVLDSKELWP